MKQKCNMFIILFLILLALFVRMATAEPISVNISSLQIINLTHSENEFKVFSPKWSTDGRYLIFEFRRNLYLN
jgi:hypothetical protein